MTDATQKLIEAAQWLDDAGDEVESWAVYADEYFQEKYRLVDELAKIRQRAQSLRTALAAAPQEAEPPEVRAAEPMPRTYDQGVADERERCWRVAMGPGGLGDEESYWGRTIAEAILNTGHAHDSRIGRPTLDAQETGAKLRCRRCGDHYSIEFQYAKPTAPSVPAPAAQGVSKSDLYPGRVEGDTF